LPPGTKLDRFGIVRMLGRGSVGQVYLAHDEFSEQDVALKIVGLGSRQADELASLLRYEKSVYNKIRDHRHVLKVNDIHQVRHGGAEFLLLSLEYADDGSLRQWLTEHIDDWPLRRSQGLEHFKQLCKGVAALHEVGVSHLDAKPENFLFKDGVLKVSDLGTSGLRAQRNPSSDNQYRDFTLETNIGTPYYMSPEHFTSLRSDLDCRCDIYSLGIMLYEILSPRGRPPFQGDYERLRDLHTAVAPPPLEGADANEARVVRRCLEKNPARRYQTVAELLEDLEDNSTEHIDNESDAQSRIDYLWSSACESLEADLPEDCRRFCRQLIETCPDHEEAREILAQLDARFEEAGGIYSTVEMGMNSRSLDELAGLVIAAVDVYPNHPKGANVQIQLQARSEQYLVTMEEGLAALRQGSWEHAKAMFEKARTYNPGAVEVERAIRFAGAVLEQITETRGFIDAAIEAGAYDRALALAEALDRYIEDRKNEIITLIERSQIQVE
jgi:serine/threonine protein kinase